MSSINYKALPPIKRLIQTDFNPMAVVDIEENTNLAKAESEKHVVFLNVLGTMKVSRIDELSMPPAIGKEIIDRYSGDYLNINEENEEFYIFTKNFISLSIYKKINSGKDIVLVNQYLDNKIAKYLDSINLSNHDNIVNEILKTIEMK